MGPTKDSHKVQEVRRKQILGCKNISGRKGDVSSKLIFVSFLVSLVLLVICLKACHVSSPEEKIRKLIQTASKMVEKRDLSKSLSYVSTEYQDDAGFDYQTLAYAVREVFRTYPKLSVSYKIHSVSVLKDRAEVNLTAEVLGISPMQRSVDLLVWRGNHHFLVTFKKIPKEWKVVATKKSDETE